MRIRVRDGVPMVESVSTKTRTAGGLSEHTDWRPLDKPPFEKHPEDREAREAWWALFRDAAGRELMPLKRAKLLDGMYELVEEHGEGCPERPHDCGPRCLADHKSHPCWCPAGWPRKTLRRVGDA